MHPGRVRAKATIAGLLAGVALTGVASLAPAPLAAQDLGFLFGRAAQPRSRDHRRRPARIARAVPIPVPRPHFPGDAAAPEPTPPPATTATQAERRPTAPSTPEGTAREVREGTRGDTTPEDGGAKAGGAPASPSPPGPAPEPKASSKDASQPAVAPSGAATAFNPRQPAPDDACPGRLAAGHVGAEPTTLGPQPDARCTVVQPVRLSDLTTADGLKVTFPDHPLIACETADAFTRYVRELLVPLAKGSYGLPVDAVWTGPGLECRSRDHIFGAKLSAHGQGLAIDIAQIKLADGRRIEVGDPRTATDQTFETAARAAACGYFHTTLGPGSDSYHRNHWHFDLEQRGRTGDGKYCK